MDDTTRPQADSSQRGGGPVLQPRLGHGLLFFATEPHNKFVRFHAMQAMLVFGPACILLMLCASIPFLGWILAPFVLIDPRSPG